MSHLDFSTNGVLKVLEQVFQAIDAPVILNDLLLFCFAISSEAPANRPRCLDFIQLVLYLFWGLKKAFTTVSIRYGLLIIIFNFIGIILPCNTPRVIRSKGIFEQFEIALYLLFSKHYCNIERIRIREFKPQLIITCQLFFCQLIDSNTRARLLTSDFPRLFMA